MIVIILYASGLEVMGFGVEMWSAGGMNLRRGLSCDLASYREARAGGLGKGNEVLDGAALVVLILFFERT